MTARVGVITDSTADLPRELSDEIGLRVVPMSVTIGGTTYISRITISDEEFYERLQTTHVLPTTAQPSPAWFEEAMADCVDDGLEAATCIHVSKELSGTVGAAIRAGNDAGLDVTVIDSRQVGGGLALMALAAHEVAQDGGSVEQIRARVDSVGAGLVNFVVVDTLEYMRRGGRVSGTQAMMGRALQVKPILQVADGRIEAIERTRTMGRGIDRLAALVAEAVGEVPTDVVVTHALAPDRADELWALLNDRISIASSLTTVFGPVLGTHTGPGAVAVAASPAG